VIDTHCHLTFPDFRDSVAETLSEAARHAVTGCITISTTTSDCLDAQAIAQRYPNVWCTAGVHPLYSDQGPHRWDNLLSVARSSRCVAWGELGLDNHYETPHRDVQDRVLAEQLAFIETAHASGGVNLPIVIHCREAFADLLPVLRRTRLEPTRFVFHCFTGTPDEARRVLDFGAMISFTGVVTYRNAADVQGAAKLTPVERMMVETDAPFLSPDPHRGKRPCKPWMASVTARYLADLKGMGWEEFHARINDNTQRFFGIDASASGA
jgi:TatD DNase family protein